MHKEEQIHQRIIRNVHAGTDSLQEGKSGNENGGEHAYGIVPFRIHMLGYFESRDRHSLALCQIP
jgi:hypothetical protein